VHQPGGVRRLQTPARLQHHLEHLTPPPAPLRQPRPERPPLDELERQPHPIAERPDVVDRHHVRVVEPRQRLRLAQLPGPRRRAAVLRAQELQRHLAIELRIVRRIHDPHPPGTELAQHHEATDLRPPPQPAAVRPFAREGHPAAVDARRVRRGHARRVVHRVRHLGGTNATRPSTTPPESPIVPTLAAGC
jgi:hypothetical protein